MVSSTGDSCVETPANLSEYDIFICWAVSGLITYVCKVAFRGREGAFVPLKTGWPPWAMLCVLLLILFLKDS